MAFEECKEMLPVGQRSFGPGFDQRIGTDEKDFAVFTHLLTHRGSVHPQLLSCPAGLGESMPTGKDLPYFSEHVFSEAIGLGA